MFTKNVFYFIYFFLFFDNWESGDDDAEIFLLLSLFSLLKKIYDGAMRDSCHP